MRDVTACVKPSDMMLGSGSRHVMSRHVLICCHFDTQRVIVARHAHLPTPTRCTMTTDAYNFRARLKGIVGARLMNQTQIARHFDIDRSMVTRWLDGGRPFSLNHAAKMVELMNAHRAVGDVEFEEVTLSIALVRMQEAHPPRPKAGATARQLAEVVKDMEHRLGQLEERLNALTAH